MGTELRCSVTAVLDSGSAKVDSTISPMQPEILAREAVPEVVLGRLEAYSRWFVPPVDYRPGNFSAYYRMAHSNGDQTFIAQQIKPDVVGEIAKFAYFFSLDSSGEIVAKGDFQTDFSGEFPPTIGLIQTEGTKRRGHAERLIGVMSEFAKTHYGSSLHSGDVSPGGRGFFERLTDKGKAHRYSKDGKVNYSLL